MSNMPVFYVDELMCYLSGEEWKVLAFLNHKIVGDKIPFDGIQTANLDPQDIAERVGLSAGTVNWALKEFLTYGIAIMTMNENGPAWMMGPLDGIDIKGLAAPKRKKAR